MVLQMLLMRFVGSRRKVTVGVVIFLRKKEGFETQEINIYKDLRKKYFNIFY